MGNRFHIVLISVLTATSVATCAHAPFLKNADVLKADAVDTVTAETAKLSFVSSMGCSDPDCTNPEHYHSCDTSCEDLDHYHECDETCNHAVGQHHGDNYCTKHHTYDTCYKQGHTSNDYYGGRHHAGSHHHH